MYTGMSDTSTIARNEATRVDNNLANKLDLQKIANRLGSIHQLSSKHFIELGIKLQSLHQKSEEMSGLSLKDKSAESGSIDKEFLSGIGVSAQEVLTDLKEKQADNQTLFMKISDTIAVIKRLLKNAEAIANLGGQLEIIGINLAIQTSRHSHGTETFEDFSSEIKGFSAYTSRFADEIQQDALEVIQVLVTVKSQLDKKIDHMSGFITQAKLDNRTTIREIERLVSQEMDRMSRSAEHSQSISKSINSAIIAIQIDDITRQRLEHIEEALRNGDREKHSIEERLIVAKLQTHQLHETQNSIVQAIEEIRNDFQKIEQEIRAIDALSEESRYKNTNSMASSLGELRSTMEDLEKVHAEAGDVRRSVALSLDSAIQASERISRHIGDVSIITQELNLKAINALLMSRDLGSEGNNLVVLAKELHSLSKDSINFVDELKRTIEHVAEVTTHLKQSTIQQSTDDESVSIFSDNFLLIDSLVDQLSHVAERSHSLSRDISKEIRCAMTELDGISKMSGDLSRCETDLNIQMDGLLPYAQTGETSNAFLDNLYTQYTMEEERKVHRKMNRESSPEPADLQQDSGETEDDGNELGDFELF